MDERDELEFLEQDLLLTPEWYECPHCGSKILMSQFFCHFLKVNCDQCGNPIEKKH